MIDYRNEQQKKHFYRSSSWETLRQQALKRDNYECQLCKLNGKVHVDSIKSEGEKKSIQLNVHHIKEIEYHPELALEIDNLLTVCLRCHNKEHGRFTRKENKWEHDECW